MLWNPNEFYNNLKELQLQVQLKSPYINFHSRDEIMTKVQSLFYKLHGSLMR